MPGEEVKNILLSANEEGLEELTERATEKEDSGNARGTRLVKAAKSAVVFQTAQIRKNTLRSVIPRGTGAPEPTCVFTEEL